METNKSIKVEPSLVRCGKCGNISLYGKGEEWSCKVCGAKGGK